MMSLLKMKVSEVKELVRKLLFSRMPDDAYDYTYVIVDDTHIVIKVFVRVMDYDGELGDYVWKKPVGITITIKAKLNENGDSLEIVEVS